MGDFKDKNGKTRAGKFLQTLAKTGKNVAPEILELASDITGVKALEKLGNMIDGSSLSPEDKQIAKDLLEFDIEEAKNITDRWRADMTSDSWLSKNVRPLVLIWSWLLLTICVLIDSGSNSFNMPEFYLNLLIPLLLTVNAAYFGERAIRHYKMTKR